MPVPGPECNAYCDPERNIHCLLLYGKEPLPVGLEIEASGAGHAEYGMVRVLAVEPAKEAPPPIAPHVVNVPWLYTMQYL